MNEVQRAAAAALALALLTGCNPGGIACDAPVALGALPDSLVEVSGAGMGLRDPAILWTHSDSEEGLLYALDLQSLAHRATFRLDTPHNDDWEDMAVAPCAQGSCIYIGAIGDNLHERDDRALLVLPEPAPDSRGVMPIARHPFHFPNGPQDAEALFIAADGTPYIVTKGRNGPITVYRYPLPLRPGHVTLETVQQLSEGLVQIPAQITGADARGRRVVIRSYGTLRSYRMDGDTLATLGADSVDLAPLGEFQGEAVALDGAGRILLTGERGLADQPPAPVGAIRCGS